MAHLIDAAVRWEQVFHNDVEVESRPPGRGRYFLHMTHTRRYAEPSTTNHDANKKKRWTRPRSIHSPAARAKQHPELGVGSRSGVFDVRCKIVKTFVQTTNHVHLTYITRKPGSRYGWSRAWIHRHRGVDGSPSTANIPIDRDRAHDTRVEPGVQLGAGSPKPHPHPHLPSPSPSPCICAMAAPRTFRVASARSVVDSLAAGGDEALVGFESGLGGGGSGSGSGNNGGVTGVHRLEGGAAPLWEDEHEAGALRMGTGTFQIQGRGPRRGVEVGVNADVVVAVGVDVGGASISSHVGRPTSKPPLPPANLAHLTSEVKRSEAALEAMSKRDK
ncbi:hypothetical protein B0H11DRAFT_1898603 [Mycena galericulata]|nr:hypothetical protein B0H11DRAFT_1898603 [Mycena galericulata]